MTRRKEWSAYLTLGRESVGEKLLGEITCATGLPEDAVTKELEKLMTAAGISRSDLTLEDLRQILADYLQDVLLEAKEELTKSS